MTTEAKILRAVNTPPDDGTIEDVIECLCLLAKIEIGARQADTGQTVSDAEVSARMAKWLR